MDNNNNDEHDGLERVILGVLRVQAVNGDTSASDVILRHIRESRKCVAEQVMDQLRYERERVTGV